MTAEPVTLTRSGDFATSLERLPDRLRGGVVAIGNFDGVHRGHQAVLAAVREDAAARPAPAVVLTFEPHPRTFFRPEMPVFRLTPAPVKAAVLEAIGLDGVAVARFDASFAALSPDRFVDEVLVGALAARCVVIGDDFRYGARRAGNLAHLTARAAAAGFDVRPIAQEADSAGGAISSSRIRTALEAGDVEIANRLLGYRWLVSAPVIPGDRRGRAMGYPTANQRLSEDCRLRHGIYAVRAAVDGRWHDGVASFGRRPTFDNGAPLLETFLFDFAGDLYGRTMSIAFVAFLRVEARFDSMEGLVAQMRRDSDDARAALAGLSPLTPIDATLSAGLAGRC